MTAQTRRSIATLLVAVTATLVALTVSTTVRQEACLDAGGRWLAERRCELDPAPGSARASLLGALSGVLTAAVLWRTYTFFVARGGRR